MNQMRLWSTSSRSFVLVLAALSMSVLGACSGGSDESSEPTGSGVASIPRASSTSVPDRTTAAAAVERPLIRLDSTPDEIQRLFDNYTKCLDDKGVPSKKQRASSDRVLTDKEKAGVAACAGKEPEDYQEREQREHPAAFKDKQRKQVKCMREHGLAIETNAEGWGYTNPARDMGSAWDKKCERQAFGG